MRRAARALALLVASVGIGCGPYDYCEGTFYDCTNDDECYPSPLPRGKCLDDRAVGRICALYHESCPTKLRWARCAGVNGQLSPWADRCVRPEFLPDASPGDGAADMAVALPDMGDGGD